MTTIATPNQLPAGLLNMQTVRDQAEAVKVAAGRRAWLYVNAMNNMIVYIEIGEKSTG